MILLPGRFPIRACHARIDLKQNEKPVNQQLLLNAECTFYNIVKFFLIAVTNSHSSKIKLGRIIYPGAILAGPAHQQFPT